MNLQSTSIKMKRCIYFPLKVDMNLQLEAWEYFIAIVTKPNLQFNVVVLFRNNFNVNFVFLKCVKTSSDIVVLHKWWLVMYLLKKKQVYNNSE